MKMKILIADDELPAIEVLEKGLVKILGNEAEIVTARSGRRVLEIIDENNIDVIFLDVEMPGANGIEIAERVRKKSPSTNIVMCTAYKKYAMEAWDLYVSGYLLKPAEEADIRKALENLRTPVVEKLTVKCFGHFEIFHNDEILQFKRSGAKEVFAILVDRCGKSVSIGELCSVLWDDARDMELKQANIRKYAMEIRRTLETIGFEDVLYHVRGSYAVNMNRLDCDYYRFLEGDTAARRLYCGEYMIQYSWSEVTNARLESLAF